MKFLGNGILVGLAGLGALLAGCNSGGLFDNSQPPKTRAEAGTVLVSVNSVAPWDEVARAMQPTFAMPNGDAALNNVVPRTQRITEQAMRALGLRLGVGLPRTSTSVTDTVTSALSSATTTTDGQSSSVDEATRTTNTSKVRTKEPGQVPEISSDLPSGAERLSAEDIAGEIGLDPFLHYKAATALYQEVQLLSREVQYVAQRGCYAPYLVRLRLTAMPYRRNIPFDIHTKIAFFHGDGDRPPVLVARSDELNRSIRDGLGLTEIDAARGSGRAAFDRALARACLKVTTPYVVPILATDNLERAVVSRTLDVTRQIGLAVNFMVSGVGGEAGVDNVNQRLDAVLADDINSLFTVSRLTDNSLYVRIGASQQASNEHALVGRTYDVSLLLLVPLGYFNTKEELLAAFAHNNDSRDSTGDGGSAPPVRISIVSRHDYRRTADGQLMVDPSLKQTLARYEREIAPIIRADEEFRSNWEKAKDADKLCLIGILRSAVHKSDYQAFVRAAQTSSSGTLECGLKLGRLANDESLLRFLWLGLAGAEADNPYKAASFELPIPSEVLIAEQTVVLREFEGQRIEAVITDASGVVPDQIGAWLVDVSDELTSGFPARRIDVNETAKTVTLTFPPLADFGVTKTALENYKLRLEPRPCAVHVWPLCRNAKYKRSFDLRYAKLPRTPPTPGLALRSPQSEIVLKDGGLGEVKLYVEKLADDAAVISAVGALIASAVTEADTPATLKPVDNQVTMTRNGTIKLSLSNLRVGKAVEITATGRVGGKDTGKTSISLSVVAPK